MTQKWTRKLELLCSGNMHIINLHVQLGAILGYTNLSDSLVHSCWFAVLHGLVKWRKMSQSLFILKEKNYESIQNSTDRLVLIINKNQWLIHDDDWTIGIGIENRYQSIITNIRLIDCLSISNTNRLIGIDWHRLSSIIDFVDCMNQCRTVSNWNRAFCSE